MACFLSLVDVQSKPVGTCPLVDSKVNTIHLADSEDCSVYYTCQLGKPVLHKCPVGLHFNPSLWMCDSPRNAGCSLGRSTSVGLTKPACPAVGICPEGGATKNLPHAENCSLYCVCNHGVLVTNSCPSGLWFSRQLDDCVIPLDSDCQALCPALENCPDSSGESLLPHRFDCSLYCKCLNGTPFAAACAPGLWFNSRKGKCDAPELSGCVPSKSQLGNEEASKNELHRSTSISTSYLIQQLATITQSSSTVDTTTVPYDSKYSTLKSEEWIIGKVSKVKSTVPTAPFDSDSKFASLSPPFTTDLAIINSTKVQSSSMFVTSTFPESSDHRSVSSKSPTTNYHYWKPILQSETVDIRTGDEALSTLPYTNSAPQLVINPSVAAALPTKLPPLSSIKVVPFSPNKQSSTPATRKIIVTVPHSSQSQHDRGDQIIRSKSSTDSSRTRWKNISKSSIQLPRSPSTKGFSVTIDSRMVPKRLPAKPRTKTTFYCDADGVCPQASATSVAVVLPSRTSCEVFCLCEDGAPITMRCPNGRHFSATLKLCDDPSQAGCVRKSGW